MPPKKGKKMNLDEFLMDSTTGGSWADEMDALPTGPSGIPTQPGELGGSHLSRNQRDQGGFGDRSRPGGGFGDDRPMRQEVPIPNAPPYTAFVGNLSFEAGEAELADFFGTLDVTSIRIVLGFDLKPKGFGYVEFATVDGLKSALALSGTEMNGRTVRISVAEAPKPGSGREGRADEDATWTRSGPLAPLPGRSGGFGGGGGGFGGGGGGGGFDRPREPREGGFGAPRSSDGGPEVEREGPIRGGKFVPSAPDAPRRAGGFDRVPSGSSSVRGGDGPREFTPAPVVETEREGPIRGGKFVPSAPALQQDRRTSGPADEERTWTRHGPLPPPPGREGRSGGFGAPGPRSFGDRTPPTSGENTPSAPATRQRLQLSARSTNPSTSPSPSGSPVPAAPASTRPSPFGAAKPVDNASRQAEVDAKLARDRELVQKKLSEERDRRERERREDQGSKERDRDEKLAKARFGAPEKKDDPASASAPAPPANKEDEAKPVSVPTALRKEGFSYSSAAVADATTKLHETTL